MGESGWEAERERGGGGSERERVGVWGGPLPAPLNQ